MDAVPEARDQRPCPEKGARRTSSTSASPGVRGETMLHALEAEGGRRLHRLGLVRRKSARFHVLTAMGVPWTAPRAPCASAFRRTPPLRRSTTPPKCFSPRLAATEALSEEINMREVLLVRFGKSI